MKWVCTISSCHLPSIVSYYYLSKTFLTWICSHILFYFPLSTLCSHQKNISFLQKFLDSSKLKRHFLIHTGERDFVCPHEGCGKVINRSIEFCRLTWAMNCVLSFSLFFFLTIRNRNKTSINRQGKGTKNWLFGCIKL